MTSVPTVLIPAQQWARRSGNGRGSAACTEQVGESRVTVRNLPGKVSRIWLECFSKARSSGEELEARCHAVTEMAFRPVRDWDKVTSRNQSGRRTPNDGAKRIESQPSYDAAPFQVNRGSPKLVDALHQYGDGAPIVPNGRPVMGSAAARPDGARIETGNEPSAMRAKPQTSRGSGAVSVTSDQPERRSASALRPNE